MNKLASVYEENHNGVIDLRSKSNHPLSLKYGEIFSSALIDANVRQGRLLPYFELNKNAPFYKAAKAGFLFEEKMKSFNAVRTALNDFYEKFQPKSISDWFLLNAHIESNLRKFPAWAAVLPWRARSVKSFQETIEDGTRKDNEKDGLQGGIEKGWAYCGPVSEEKLSIEAKRINELIYSFRKNGYQRSFENDGDIVATALVNKKNDWCWLVTSGYHRACVLAAMGEETIPVRVNLVIREDEADFWPHVSSGFYSKDMAIHIFRNIFQPQVNWS